MTEDDQVDASQLEVDAENGIVTLHGTVPDREYKKQAEQVAEPVSGVRDVRNQLEIKGAMVDDLSDQARRSSSPGRQGMDELGAFRDPIWARQDLRGFEVEARDGKIGAVDASSASGADHLIVDTGTWIIGRKVVLPAGLVERVSFEERRLLVSRSKDEIRRATCGRPALRRGAACVLQRWDEAGGLGPLTIQLAMARSTAACSSGDSATVARPWSSSLT